MSDSFRAATGRKVVSRASAQEVGTLGHFLVDAKEHRISAVVVGRGKKAQLVDWEHVSGFGGDAVMVSDEGSLRSPLDDRERAGTDGKLDLVGKRVLTDRGNELGTLDDVTFDPQTGILQALRIGGREMPAPSLLGGGSYAVVVDGREEPAP